MDNQKDILKKLTSQFIELCFSKKDCSQLQKFIAHLDLNTFPVESYQRGFELACYYGHIEKIQYLLNHPTIKEHIDVTAKNNYSVRVCSERGHLDLLKYLIEHPTLNAKHHIDAEEHYALRFACEKKQWHIMEYLFSIPQFYQPHDTKINESCFMQLCENNNYKVFNDIYNLFKQNNSIDLSFNHNEIWKTCIINNYIHSLTFLATVPEINEALKTSLRHAGFFSFEKSDDYQNNMDIISLLMTIPNIRHHFDKKNAACEKNMQDLLFFYSMNSNKVFLADFIFSTLEYIPSNDTVASYISGDSYAQHLVEQTKFKQQLSNSLEDNYKTTKTTKKI